jgi:N-acetylglutamate synthase-like GNAT family acetyltransferase
MEIKYKENVIPPVEQIVALYELAALPRPTHDLPRIKKIFDHANLIISAWHEQKLVGIARSITDFAWSCYLADLAVHPDYQKQGIGNRLIQITKSKVGDETMILLLSVPTAMEYYPKVGFTKENRSFAIHRVQ